MGNPRLLQELPNIAALLSHRGSDGEQSAPAGGALAGLDAMADLPLNHRLAQGTYSCGEDVVYGGVVRGFDTFDRQERPEAIGHGQQLIAGADCFGPRRSLAALMAQLHHPPQRSLKGLADRYAGLLQVEPIDCALIVAVPVGKQLSLQLQQFQSEVGTGAQAFGDGTSIPPKVLPSSSTYNSLVQMVSAINGT